jgi:hypothetical protein
LTTAQVSNLTTDQVKALTTAQILNMTADQTKAFTTSQVQALETRDLAMLSEATNFTTAQVAVMSAAQNSALPD